MSNLKLVDSNYVEKKHRFNPHSYKKQKYKKGILGWIKAFYGIVPCEHILNKKPDLNEKLLDGFDAKQLGYINLLISAAYAKGHHDFRETYYKD